MRSPVTWIIVLGLALAGGAYLLYRRSTAAAAAGTTSATTDTPAGTTNPDWSGEIATLQTEIMDLQSSESQEDNDDDKTTGTGAKRPGAPRNLRLTGDHGTSVQVSWDMPGGVKGIAWSVTGHEGTIGGRVTDKFTTNNTVANLAGAKLNPRGLKPGSRYVVTVQGRNSAGMGPVGSLGFTTRRGAGRLTGSGKTIITPGPGHLTQGSGRTIITPGPGHLGGGGKTIITGGRPRWATGGRTIYSPGPPRKTRAHHVTRKAA